MVSETAVALATERELLQQQQEQLLAPSGSSSRAAGAASLAGFLTPATALGPLLQQRLHAEGIRFEEMPLPEGVSSPKPDDFM